MGLLTNVHKTKIIIKLIIRLTKNRKVYLVLISKYVYNPNQRYHEKVVTIDR